MELDFALRAVGYTDFPWQGICLEVHLEVYGLSCV